MASELAQELATLQGWTEIRENAGPSFRTFGLPPNMTDRARVPEPDTDPAACMELLCYVEAIGSVTAFEICGGMCRTMQLVTKKVFTGICPNIDPVNTDPVKAKCEAIALCCLEVLKELSK
jgi:hypothetical protein